MGVGGSVLQEGKVRVKDHLSARGVEVSRDMGDQHHSYRGVRVQHRDEDFPCHSQACSQPATESRCQAWPLSPSLCKAILSSAHRSAVKFQNSCE